MLQLPGQAGDRLVTLNIQDATGEEISNALRAQFDVPVEFRLADPDARLSIDAASMPLGELLRMLASRGAIATVTDLGSLEHAKLSALVSLQVHDFAPAQIATMLGDMLGIRVEFVPKRDDDRVSLDVQDMPVGAVLKVLANYGQLSTPGL